jgi:hypothetical protein
MVGPLGAGGRGFVPPAAPPAPLADPGSARAASPREARGPVPGGPCGTPAPVSARDLVPAPGASPVRPPQAQAAAAAAARAPGRPATAEEVARVAPPLIPTARRQ